MCATCGCSGDAPATVTELHAHDGHEHAHEHEDAHAHGHDGVPHLHASPPSRTVVLEQEVLAKNALGAAHNRGFFDGRGIVALNLVSSPGAGKTTLLEKTLHALAGELPIAVVEGDQETLRDAERIRATGCRVIQVNTGSACHLDAEMVARAVRVLDPPARSLLFVENVGNLVCPAMFDLGERAKVVVMSVTEGDDKPLKYPHMFRAAKVMVLSKLDLLPYVAFDVERCLAWARQVNPRLRVFQLCATRGDGVAEWLSWLRGEHARRSDGAARDAAGAG